jgi:two-component system sensor histidine kinase BaeS
MIRFTIQRKVFIATFALSATMALLLIGLMRWNLEQGFRSYVVKAELGKLDWLVRSIEEAYEQHGNWDFLRGDADAWNRLHRRPAPDVRGPEAQAPEARMRADGFPPPRPEGAPEFDRPDRPPPMPGMNNGPRADIRPDILGIRQRISLRDISGNLLAGNPQPDRLAASRPINNKGRVVGTLSLLPPQTSDALNATFLATQTRDLMLSGLAALLLSLLAAWLLARQFLAPIHDLAAGARHIAGGRFSERIPVRRSDELGELAADFNAMAEMLERTEEIRRQWISDSSHELRTPIAVLRAEIEALQDGVRISDEKTLARLHKQVMQMSKLVDDLRLTLDKDVAQTNLELTTLAPLAMLRESIAEFEPRYAAANVALDVAQLSGADRGFRIRGDADRLHQVFANLLENTLRYTHHGGKLRITAASAAGRMHIQFDDTAPAPPLEAMPRLFERFFRAEPSRSREFGGSGLGLAICKAIVEAHRGTITARKSELGGLCMRIELPLENFPGKN